jgi:hypothetical protein
MHGPQPMRKSDQAQQDGTGAKRFWDGSCRHGTRSQFIGVILGSAQRHRRMCMSRHRHWLADSSRLDELIEADVLGPLCHFSEQVFAQRAADAFEVS